MYETFKIGIYFFFIFLLFSCNNDDEENIIEQPILVNEEKDFVEATFFGFVLDQEGEPIVSASVSTIDKMVLTDENGFYSITGNISANGAYLRIVKLGYFDSFANVIPSENKSLQLNFNLIPKNVIDQFSATSGAIIQQNNYTIKFEPNSIQDLSGVRYDGEVYVYSRYVDPLNDNISEFILGNLLGENLGMEETVLSSFGMVNVEIETPNGESLQLSKPAELTISVPDEIIEHAPDIIPIWYLDVEDGLWKEDGFAELSNGIYIGQVSHFTIWGFCFSWNTFTFKGHINNYGSILNKDIFIYARGVEIPYYSFCTIDDTGQFSIIVPLNSEFEISILNSCGVNLFTDVFGSNSLSSEEVNIELNNIMSNNLVSNLNVHVDLCEEVITDHVFVNISINGSPAILKSIDLNGDFTHIISDCTINTSMQVEVWIGEYSIAEIITEEFELGEDVEISFTFDKSDTNPEITKVTIFEGEIYTWYVDNHSYVEEGTYSYSGDCLGERILILILEPRGIYCPEGGSLDWVSRFENNIPVDLPNSYTLNDICLNENVQITNFQESNPIQIDEYNYNYVRSFSYENECGFDEECELLYTWKYDPIPDSIYYTLIFYEEFIPIVEYSIVNNKFLIEYYDPTELYNGEFITRRVEVEYDSNISKYIISNNDIQFPVDYNESIGHYIPQIGSVCENFLEYEESGVSFISFNISTLEFDQYSTNGILDSTEGYNFKVLAKLK